MHTPRSRTPVLAGFIIAAATLASPASAQPCSPAEVAKLLASDGAAQDGFGSSVSVSGDVAVIGADVDDDNGTRSGSAYVYRFDGTNWAEEAKLLPADGTAFDGFGAAMTVSGDTVIIGAAGDDDNGASSGSAYVFRFDGTSWMQETKLLANDGEAGDGFGVPMTASGDTVIIGATGGDDNGTSSGSAYVYRFDGTNWVQEAKLLPDDGEANDRFGSSVSVSVDTAVIGAYLDTDNGNASGSAYIFRYGDTNWVQEAKLLPADGAIADWFGKSVSVSGNTAVVGAFYDDDNGISSGSAYVYRYDGAGWVQEAKLLAADGAGFNWFGQSVTVSGNTAVIGARQSDDKGQLLSGSAYVFELNCAAPCLPDVNGDGMLSPTDFTAWINAFNNNLPECDQNGDGSCTPTDFTAWIANFNAGC